MMDGPDSRRVAIAEEARASGMVRVSDLSRRFGVSTVSIRRDLAKLEEIGLLKRVYGGAVSLPSASLARSYETKLKHRLEEKKRIGRAAVGTIRDGDCVILDSGTTVLQIARALLSSVGDIGQLTVITPSFPVFRELSMVEDVQLFVLGGMYLPEYQTLVGPQTLACLRGFHANKLFLGSDGLSLDHGVTTAHVLEAEVSRAMVKAASEIIVVADSSKIDSVGFTTIIPVTDVHKLITDSEAPDEFVRELERRGVEVVLA